MPARKKSPQPPMVEAKAPAVGRFIVEMHEMQLEAWGGPEAVAERFGAQHLGTVVNPHDRVARVELEA